MSGVRKGEVIQWRGVPYAAPPVGPLRFRPPVSPPAWEGVRQATAFAPAAPQATSPLQNIVGGQPGTWSEDCLYLNVFAPAHRTGPLPVMVWIHGGAFIGGSGSARWYDGGRFAAAGAVVVVTLNYRLGALGFLALGDRFESSGNLGLLDQLAALRWVQDNIAAFGGDASQVTVFGESAGAMSIGTMLAMPAAAGLFHRAILQSGAAAAYRSRSEAEAVTERTLAAFGGTVAELVAAPVEQVLAAQVAVTGGSDSGAYLAFRPVVDGLHVPEAPDDALAGGRSWATRSRLPVLIGTNRDEMTLFVAFDPGVAGMTEAQVERRAVAMVGAERWARLAPAYQAPEGVDRWVAFTTDLVFRIPAVRVAEALARHGAPVWMYRFDCPSPASGATLGATHAIEIPYVWDLLATPGVELFTGSSEGRDQLARAVHAAWLAFAIEGDPTTPLLPRWPRYQLSERATMVLDERSQVVADPHGAERRLWA